MQSYFEIVEIKPLGGALLHFLLDGIAGNFRDEAGDQWLDLLLRIEDDQMKLGRLQSDIH